MLLFSFHRLSRWQKWHWDYEWLKTKLLCLFNWCEATFWNKAVVSLMSSKLHAKHYYDTRSKTISFTNWNIDKYVTFDDMIVMCVCARNTCVTACALCILCHFWPQTKTSGSPKLGGFLIFIANTKCDTQRFSLASIISILFVFECIRRGKKQPNL